MQNRNVRIILVLLFTLLICIRIPTIISESRFWSEEGSVFFRNAWNLPWTNALFLSYGGYLNLSANLAGILAAHLLPLEYAPYASTTLALFVQICPAILICTSNCKWLKPFKIQIAALLLVATQPASQEVWLSSIGSQCHLNLSLGIILALEIGSRRMEAFKYFLLALCALSGPGAVFLAPLYVVRSIVDRSKERAIQAGILGVACLVQLLFFVHSEVRSFSCDLKFLISVLFVKNILLPFMGRQEAEPIAKFIFQSFNRGHLPLLPQLVALTDFGALLIAVKLSRQKEALWFFWAAMILALGAYCGALGDRACLFGALFGNRYVYAPTALFELSLLSAALGTKGMFRTALKTVIIWLLIIGAHEYFSTSIEFAHGPKWRNEVATWRKDASHPLAIWPTGWTIQLDRSHLSI